MTNGTAMDLSELQHDVDAAQMTKPLPATERMENAFALLEIKLRSDSAGSSTGSTASMQSASSGMPSPSLKPPSSITKRRSIVPPSPTRTSAHIARIRAANARTAPSSSFSSLSASTPLKNAASIRRTHSTSDLTHRLARTISSGSLPESVGKVKKVSSVETRRASALTIRTKVPAGTAISKVLHQPSPSSARKPMVRRRSTTTGPSSMPPPIPTLNPNARPRPLSCSSATTSTLAQAAARMQRVRSSGSLIPPPRTPDRSAPSSRNSSACNSPMMSSIPSPAPSLRNRLWPSTSAKELKELVANDELSVDDLKKVHHVKEREVQALLSSVVAPSSSSSSSLSSSSVGSTSRARQDEVKRLRSGLKYMSEHSETLLSACEILEKRHQEQVESNKASDAEIRRLHQLLQQHQADQSDQIDDTMDKLELASTASSEEFLLIESEPPVPTASSAIQPEVNTTLMPLNSPIAIHVNEMMKKATEQIETKWKARFAEQVAEHEKALAQERDRSSASLVSNARSVTEAKHEKEEELKRLRDSNAALVTQQKQVEIELETLRSELEWTKKQMQQQDEERSTSAHTFWQKTTDLAKENRALTEELTQVNQTVSKLQEALKDARSQATQVRAENDLAVKRMKELEMEKQVLVDQQTAVNEKFQDEKARREQFQVQVEQLTVENTALYAQMVALQTMHEAKMEELRARFEQKNGVLVGEMRLLQTQNMLMRQSECLDPAECGVGGSFALSDDEQSTMDDPQQLNERLKDMTDELLAVRQELTERNDQIAALEAKIAESELVRRKLHNTIQELRGNVRVHVRVRPFLRSDGDEAQRENPKSAIQCDTFASTISTTGEKAHAFAFDKVYDQSDTQDSVFHDVSDFIQSAMDGYNVCIFAYGQTGSGKTHTMQGSGKNQMRGIIPRAIQLITQCCQDLSVQGWVHTLEVSFFEIYNESIRDLLAPNASTATQPKHNIRTDRRGKNYVEGLIAKRIDFRQAEAQIEQIVTLAACNRSVDKTDMNAHSSRSHSIFALTIRGVHEAHNTEMEGSLSLVDLAGSERLSRSNATGDRLKEAQAINKSLSSLADVFQAIAKKAPHVPYRNSKLTYVLQPALSGDGKTLMMVNLSPTVASLDESLCSLRFAQQVSQCELGAPTRQIKTRGGSSSSSNASSLANWSASSPSPARASSMMVPPPPQSSTSTSSSSRTASTPSIARRLFN